MRPLPTTPDDHHGAFTAEAAVRAGWSASALSRAVTAGRLSRLAPAIFALPAGDDSPAERRRVLRAKSVAAVLRVPDAVPSHLSAACLAGLPTWTIPSRPCVTVDRRFSGDASCAHLHRAGLPAEHVLDSTVVRTTSARTVIDVAREHGLDDAIAVGDAALRSRRTSPAALERVLADCSCWPGIRRARALMPLLDGLAESPLESVSRLRMHQLHLPIPVLQAHICDERGYEVARVDCYWPEFGVVGEIDGRSKYDEEPRETVLSEKGRQERLEDLGLVAARWGRLEVMTPPLLARKLILAFRRGRARAGLPRGWTVTE